MSDHANEHTSVQAESDLSFDFIGVGEILVDVISDNLTDTLSNGERFRTFIGGQVTNIAINLAQLGARVAVLGAVGADPLGAFCRNELQRRGVNASYIRDNAKQPTTMNIVGRSRETPWFIAYRGADTRLRPEHVPQDAIVKTRILHTSAFALGYEPFRSTALEMLATAAEHGVQITFDPNYHPSVWDGSDPQAGLSEAFKHVTLTKPSLDDCIRIFGPNLEPEEYIARFHSWGAQWVVLTRGGQSTLVSDGDTITELPLPPVEVVDVTGAGDASWSAMIFALIHNQPLLTAAHAGINLAAQKVQHIGPLQTVDIADVKFW
jgi:fructokinase